MKRRIFIAINLTEDVKNKIAEMQQEFSYLPVRFTKRNSLHLTLFFIGYVTNEEMVKICEMVHEIAKRHQPFIIDFNRLCLGPPKRPPRLIWLEGRKNQELFNLKIDIENSLMLGNQDPRFFAKAEKQIGGFVPHITIARIRQMEWKKLIEKPVIDKGVSLAVPVNSIEVMESDLKRDGAEYIVLESTELRK